MLPIVLCILVVVAIRGCAMYFNWKREKERSKSYAQLAQRLGLAFVTESNGDIQNRLQRFQLFSRGRWRNARNVMTAETDGVTMTLMDYRFTTGGGKRTKHHKHSVIIFESDILNLPSFSIKPQGLLDRIGNLIGFQDINFEDHKAFSDAFVLKGENEPSIRAFFHPEIMDAILQHKDKSLECQPGVFLLHQRRVIAVDQAESFLAEAYRIFDLFTDRANAQGKTKTNTL